MLNLYKIAQIRELEKQAYDKYQLTPVTLMERAGMAAFKVLRDTWRGQKRIAVVCGKGNNGGDGYVLARLLHKANLAVTLFYVDLPQDSLLGTAKQAYLDAQKARVKFEKFNIDKLKGFDVVVDAIFGIGLHGKIDAKYQQVIDAINNCSSPVLSLDVPSGLNADTGEAAASTVRADVTVTFIGLKGGLFTYQGSEFAGQVKGDRLSLPEELFVVKAVKPLATLLHFPKPKAMLEQRVRYAHKGDFGHALVVGGDFGMPGSVRMAGEAALRVGSGLVTVATRKEHISIVCVPRPELMCVGITGKFTGLKKLLSKISVVVIGPGLGQKYSFGQALWSLVKKLKLPLVVDADALNLLAKSKKRRDDWVLTPHPGEAARLLQLPNALVIQKDRFKAVVELQKKYGGIVVLKGAGTLICDTNQRIYVCPYGNPGMAKAGMGDILAGVIGGLIAQGLNLRDATLLGTVLHSQAADRAAREVGERALLALDVMSEIGG